MVWVGLLVGWAGPVALGVVGPVVKVESMGLMVGPVTVLVRFETVWPGLVVIRTGLVVIRTGLVVSGVGPAVVRVESTGLWVGLVVVWPRPMALGVGPVTVRIEGLGF